MLGIKYNNPFMWNVIPYVDFRELVVGYGGIDFGRYEVGLFEGVGVGYRVASCLFDSRVRVHYIHYREDVSCVVPRKVSIDVYASDIVSYASDAIGRRVGRMDGEVPVFLFETRSRCRYGGSYSLGDIDDFIHLDTCYEKVLLVDREEYRGVSGDVCGCHVLFYDDMNPSLPPDTERMARLVYDRFGGVLSGVLKNKKG